MTGLLLIGPRTTVAGKRHNILTCVKVGPCCLLAFNTIVDRSWELLFPNLLNCSPFAEGMVSSDEAVKWHLQTAVYREEDLAFFP